MTPAMQRRERKRLNTAIYRWYRLGGSYDRIIETADVIYATNVAALLDKFSPKKQQD